VETMRDERSLQQMFQQLAAEFHMDEDLPGRVQAAIRRRLTGGLAGTATVMIAILMAGTGLVRAPAETEGTPTVRLMMAFINADDLGQSEGDGTGIGDRNDLLAFAGCMRGAGFEVPDPTLSGERWSIRVSRDRLEEWDDLTRWREAAFVTCRPRDLDLSGDLVISGISGAQVQEFAACMSEQGYPLPDAQRSSGHWTFDLNTVAFDTNADAWHRAALVTCGPR
jgi:hypothetical protein